MAQDEDDSQKTEEPTPRKLEEAAKKGDIAQSQEFKHWVMLLFGALAFLMTADFVARAINEQITGFLVHAHNIPVDGYAILAMAREVGGRMLVVLLLPLSILVVGAFASNLLQHKVMFTTEKIIPKLSKISPLAGAKRMFSAQRAADFLKSVAKLAIVSVAVGMILWPERGLLISLINQPVGDITKIISTLALKSLFGVIGAMTFVAGLDLIFQRMQYIKKMRMTKQEVKDEYKQIEGDPMVKQRLRQIRMNKARRRMMAAVPEASVVITNPTHYAVALRYSHGEMDVPKVVAKGVDAVALRIRKVAGEHDVPIVENRPLARALYATVDIDDDIPAEHYQAVAQIISYVLRLKKGERARYSAGSA